MGESGSNVLFSDSRRRIKKATLKKFVDEEKSLTIYRPRSSCIFESKLIEPIAHADGAVSSRIQSLENELLHYRCMLDRMVMYKTERLHRRLAILESCNKQLGENYHEIHRMYLDLLIKTQPHEAELHERVLENELATLTQKALA